MSTTDQERAVRASAARPASEIDADRLFEITDRDGFAVFDPKTPGGVRSLTDGEQDRLRREVGRASETDVDGTRWRHKPCELFIDSDRHEAYLESRPTGGPFDPTLEYGHPDWREPESDDEAAARTAHLDQQRPATVRVPPDRAPSALREIEDALAAAQLEAYLSDRAHDLDPAPAREVERLEAELDQLERATAADCCFPERSREEDELDNDELDEDEDEDEL